MEVAVDECVSGKEVLRLLAGLEALHLSFSSACGSMRVLSTIVEVATLSVLDIGQQMTLRHPIASQLVGDDHSRHVLQALQQTPEEPLGSFPITSLLDQNIILNLGLVRAMCALPSGMTVSVRGFMHQRGTAGLDREAGQWDRWGRLTR